LPMTILPGGWGDPEKIVKGIPFVHKISRDSLLGSGKGSEFVDYLEILFERSRQLI
jgi:hypothetical protein